MKNLHSLHPNPKSKKNRKRVARGESSGHGKTAGRGGKGQKARSGYNARHHEGGQNPLYRRLPKFGFLSPHALELKETAVINLRDLNVFPEKTMIDLKMLQEKGLASPATRILRILAKGDLKHGVSVKANHFSKSALEKIQGLGGQAEVL